MPVNLLTWESTNRRIKVQGDPGIKVIPVSTITTVRRAGGLAQVLEYLPSKCKALSSIPSMERRKERRKEGKQEGRRKGRKKGGKKESKLHNII
jgi:hypothetical protein